MSEEPRQRSGRSWAVEEADVPQPSVDEEVLAQTWRRFALFVGGVVTLLAGVVAVTLPQTLSYGTELDENLALKQQVQEIEDKLADVDHILLQMRLYDAQMKTLVGEDIPEQDP